MEKVSHEANAAINNFYQAFGGDFENLSLRDCQFLEEELACAFNTVSDIVTKKTTNTSKPKRGDEIQQFFFIGETRGGCPKLEQRSVGDKGITCIEVTNAGKSFLEDKHLTKVRVTGLKEDGKTEYQMYFSDVYTECSGALLMRFSNEIAKYQQMLRGIINSVQAVYDKHEALMQADLEKIYKRMTRNTSSLSVKSMAGTLSGAFTK